MRIAAAVGLVLVLAATVIGSARARHARAGAAPRQLDVLLAFDTTGSMGPSIAAAKRDARSILSAVGEFAPDSRFAVASFRDRDFPGGEYTLVSPMTSDRNALTKAIGTLHSVDSTSEFTFAEAYNLLFHQSYADTHIGWRPSARKIVVVIGDAEPHDAGADGIAGCTDKTKDWDGLDTAHEIAKLRETKRTLVFIRQASTATVSLQCYQSMAALAYEGGSAVDGGAGAGVAASVVGLVKQSYAPLAVSAQLDGAVVGRTNGLTIRVSNPNALPLTISSVQVELPKGLAVVPGTRSGTLPAPSVDPTGLLTWQIHTIPPLRTMIGHLRLRVQMPLSATIAGTLTASLPATGTVTTKSAAVVRAVRRAQGVSVSIAGTRGTSYGMSGSFTHSLRGAAGDGRLVVRRGRRMVSLQVTALRASLVGDPTRLVGRVRVAAGSGSRACARGTGGTLDVLDSDALTRAGRTYDRVTVRLPAACGGTTTLRDASGADLTVKVAFR